MKYILISGILIIIILSTFGEEIHNLFIENKKVTTINGIKVVSTIKNNLVVNIEYIRIDVIPNYKIECKEGFFISFKYRRCMPYSHIEKYGNR